MNEKRDHMNEEIVTFPSGATRSKIDARYDLICPTGMRRLAERYALGADKHGENNWCKGLTVKDCLNHIQQHTERFKISGDICDDNTAAIAWNAFAIMHIQEKCLHHEAPHIMIEASEMRLSKPEEIEEKAKAKSKSRKGQLLQRCGSCEKCIDTSRESYQQLPSGAYMHLGCVNAALNPTATHEPAHALNEKEME